MTMRTALVTGATGFAGRQLCWRLQRAGWRVIALARQPARGVGAVPFGFDLTAGSPLPEFEFPVDTIFHLAARAHALAETAADAAEYDRINVAGTQRVVDAAVRRGVRALVYVSSVKVFGDGQQRLDRGLCEEDEPRPDSPYGRSKLAAESIVLGATAIAHRVVLRPALMYGPGAKGNLAKMWSAVADSRFPPLPETGAPRSLVHRSDFCAAVELAADDGAARSRIFHVTDGQPISARGMLNAIRAAQGRGHLRFSVPASVLRCAARAGDLAGRWRGRRLPFDSDVLRKLTGPAWFDSTRLERELRWRPHHSFVSSAAELGQ